MFPLRSWRRGTPCGRPHEEKEPGIPASFSRARLRDLRRRTPPYGGRTDPREEDGIFFFASEATPTLRPVSPSAGGPFLSRSDRVPETRGEIHPGAEKNAGQKPPASTGPFRVRHFSFRRISRGFRKKPRPKPWTARTSFTKGGRRAGDPGVAFLRKRKGRPLSGPALSPSKKGMAAGPRPLFINGRASWGKGRNPSPWPKALFLGIGKRKPLVGEKGLRPRRRSRRPPSFRRLS